MDVAMIQSVGGIVKTEEQFVVVIGEKIYGPFPNARIDEVNSLFEE
ncbi:hypothetical protein P4V46_07225 [Brevibacillus borstelensis]|nr:hypothetical protein [Brevibacillus borstelensis]MED1882368.1 hypothetical protein [Brevibacillus borstelensis]